MNTNLNHWGLLRVSGSGAAKLLQGQLTCDVNALSDHNFSLGAYCNVKGRALTSFYIVRHQEGYILLMDRTLVNKTLNTLKKYAVFFDAALQDLSDQWRVLGSTEREKAWPETPGQALVSQELICLRLNEAEARYLIATTSGKSFADNSDWWLQRDIQAGLAHVTEQTCEQFIPLELNYDLLQGVSFSKGCYTGQEIIARLHYRGQSKQGLYRYESTDAVSIPPMTPVTSEDQQTVSGHVVCHAGSCGLAVIRHNAAQDQSLLVQSIRIQVSASV